MDSSGKSREVEQPNLAGRHEPPPKSRLGDAASDQEKEYL
jgi:hypothetical protein